MFANLTTLSILKKLKRIFYYYFFRDSKTKITLIKGAPQDQTCMFHIYGTDENCKTAQYIMKIKIKV